MQEHEALLVQDAAGLVAATLRRDTSGRYVLLESYANDERFPLLVEAFVYYTSAAVQIQARLSSQPWQDVLHALPEQHTPLVAEVQPDWRYVRQLIGAITNNETPARSDAELISVLEAAHSLAVSATLGLGRGDVEAAIGWSAELSRLAGLEA